MSWSISPQNVARKSVFLPSFTLKRAIIVGITFVQMKFVFFHQWIKRAPLSTMLEASTPTPNDAPPPPKFNDVITIKCPVYDPRVIEYMPVKVNLEWLLRNSHYQWFILPNTKPYVVRASGGGRSMERPVYMHRSVMNYYQKTHGVCKDRSLDSLEKKILVDHITGDTLRNEINHLRVCSGSQNAHNKAKRRGPCSSQHKGVSVVKRRKKDGTFSTKFCVDFQYLDEANGNKKVRIRPKFDTEREAVSKYNECIRLHMPEFGRINKWVGPSE